MANLEHKIIPASNFRQEVLNAYHASDDGRVRMLCGVQDFVYDDGPNNMQATPVQNLFHQTVIEDTDPHTGKPTLRINVVHMVQSYVGDGYEIQVALEKWEAEAWKYQSSPMPSKNIQIAIHLRKTEDNSNQEIITIREYMACFPSPELRAKLELLRYK